LSRGDFFIHQKVYSLFTIKVIY